MSHAPTVAGPLLEWFAAVEGGVWGIVPRPDGLGCGNRPFGPTPAEPG